MRSYLANLRTALSTLLNALLGGEAPETLSYRSAKARRSGKRWGCLMCRLLDAFDRDHCDRTLRWWEE
ncbi:hypothetical protein [Mesorhizobium sp.]|uniref:hypothetical protein n=1 Tax=Mesorhizobium sp. TaxID=1871066 RepID=UPI000FE38B74|nr:hypothetical protein [Mesorhizobium sp.]RWJ03509.1 MAG: hypothetical protein EOR24_32545 [Mesorhizobium sp.]